MRLYDSDWGPNRRWVYVFMTEKAIGIERVKVDARSGIHLEAGYDFICVSRRECPLECTYVWARRGRVSDCPSAGTG